MWNNPPQNERRQGERRDMHSSQLSTVDYLVPNESTVSRDRDAYSLETRPKNVRHGGHASPPESPSLWMPPADPFNPGSAMTSRTYQPPPQRHNPQLCLPGLKAPQSHGPDEVPTEGGAMPHASDRAMRLLQPLATEARLAPRLVAASHSHSPDHPALIAGNRLC